MKINFLNVIIECVGVVLVADTDTCQTPKHLLSEVSVIRRSLIVRCLAKKLIECKLHMLLRAGV